MYSADEIYDTAELDNSPTIPEHHFTDIDIDDIEDEGDNDDYSPVYPMPFFRPDKPDKTDEDLEPSHNDDLEPSDEDLEPSDDDDFGGSFPLSVEYDDQLEPTYIEHDDDF
jgi:hypothetical protein